MEAEFDGSLSADGAEKAAEFVQFCDAFNIPVLTLTNVSGFTASEYDEKMCIRDSFNRLFKKAYDMTPMQFRNQK